MKLEQSSGLITKSYAGIGSRETPPITEYVIAEVAGFMNKFGYTLRSGGAPGADSMFEKYAEKKEIYLPWKGFNGNESELYLNAIPDNEVDEANTIAAKYHPYWKGLTHHAKKLMIRNSFQVLGIDLKSPVQLIICWTQGGGIKGGTGQAMRIATDLKIPIFNLYNKDALHQLRIYINNLC